MYNNKYHKEIITIKSQYCLKIYIYIYNLYIIEQNVILIINVKSVSENAFFYTRLRKQNPKAYFECRWTSFFLQASINSRKYPIEKER